MSAGDEGAPEIVADEPGSRSMPFLSLGWMLFMLPAQRLPAQGWQPAGRLPTQCLVPTWQRSAPAAPGGVSARLRPWPRELSSCW